MRPYIDEDEREVMNVYIDSLEKENKHFRKVLKNIYAICTFKNGKDYNDGSEQLYDISEILEEEFKKWVNMRTPQIKWKEWKN